MHSSENDAKLTSLISAQVKRFTDLILFSKFCLVSKFV